MLLTVLKEATAPDDGVTPKTDACNNNVFERTNTLDNHRTMFKQTNASPGDVACAACRWK